jgi:hypothetical protein
MTAVICFMICWVILTGQYDLAILDDQKTFARRCGICDKQTKCSGYESITVKHGWQALVHLNDDSSRRLIATLAPNGFVARKMVSHYHWHTRNRSTMTT